MLGLGQRSKRHNFGSSFLRQPVRSVVPAGEKTVTFCLVNSMVQSASQMSPTPMRVFMNDGMKYPVVRKSCASCGIGSDAVAEEDSTWPIAAPTYICGVVASRSPCRAEGAMYICVAPESTILVS